MKQPQWNSEMINGDSDLLKDRWKEVNDWEKGIRRNRSEDNVEVGQSAGEAFLSQISRLLPARNEWDIGKKMSERSERVNEVANSGVMNYILPKQHGKYWKES